MMEGITALVTHDNMYCTVSQVLYDSIDSLTVASQQTREDNKRSYTVSRGQQLTN